MHLGQRTHFNRIVSDESRLNESAFAEFTEYFIYQLAFTHGVVNFHFQFFADLADFFFTLAIEVVTCFFLDSVQDGQAAVWCLEADGLTVDGSFFAAVHGNADTFQQFLGETHHPVVILILYVQFQTGEFRVMILVHTFVAEVLSDFIYTLEATYNQTFQVKLGSDTQIQIHIQ